MFSVLLPVVCEPSLGMCMELRMTEGAHCTAPGGLSSMADLKRFFWSLVSLNSLILHLLSASLRAERFCMSRSMLVTWQSDLMEFPIVGERIFSLLFCMISYLLAVMKGVRLSIDSNSDVVFPDAKVIAFFDKFD